MNLDNKISIATVYRGLNHVINNTPGNTSEATLEKALVKYDSLLRFLGNLFNIKVLQDKYNTIDALKKALARPFVEALTEAGDNDNMIGFTVGKIHVRIYDYDGELQCEVYSPKFKGAVAMHMDTFSIEGSIRELRANMLI